MRKKALTKGQVLWNLTQEAKWKPLTLEKRSFWCKCEVHGRIKLGNENNCIDRSQDRTLIHCVFGRNAVEVNLEKKLPKMKSDMADFIEVKQVETRVHQTKEGQGDNYWDSSFCFSWRLQGVLCQGNCWSRSNSNRDWHHHQAWWRCWLDQGKNISPIDKKVVFEKWSNTVHQKYFCELLLFSLTIKMFKGDKLKLQLVWQSLNKHIIRFLNK